MKRYLKDGVVCAALLLLAGCGGSYDSASPLLNQAAGNVSVPNVTAGTNFSFDLGTVLNGKYYLTDRNNKAVDVIDTYSLQLTQIKGTGADAFVGVGANNGVSGPDGINNITGSSLFYVGDVNNVRIVDSATGTVLKSIKVGNTGFRADEGNLIYDIEKSNYGGWAIYTDEGSSHIVIENNICYNTSSQGFHQHYGRENMIRNNIFAFSREGQIALTRAEEHNSFTFMHNIVITRNQPIFAMNPDKGKHFISDANLYWDISGVINIYGEWKVGEGKLEVWKEATGNDRNSLVADPCFENLENDHFKLKKESPAFQLGFKDIEMGDVGPRSEKARGKATIN
jgi:parallel beta-helix repeat protein